MNNNYTPITELTEGQEFRGYQQYIQVLYLTPDPDVSAPMVTLFLFCGEVHRVVQAEYYIALALVNQILDPNYDGEVEQDVKVTAIWPDDVEFDEHPELRYTEIGPVDCTTGEIYNWLP
jgi:hypothetical protein